MPDDGGDLRLPLLDQLLDEEPGVLDEPAPTAGQTHRQVVASIERDLLDLLNTRERCLSWPKELDELSRSTVSYGVPDITGANLSTVRDRDAFLQALAPIIRRCDRRFRSVRIVPDDRSDSTDRVLRFRIEAVVRVDSGSEDITFDFKLEPVTRQFES
ncbi:MAG: type VI secretion system baseplate subunit TssE [Planctomycetota bacterium]